MMIQPGITELSKCVDSRYTLVAMAAKRARMIGNEEADDEIAVTTEKPVSVAAREIAEGKVGYVRSESIVKAEEWEAEKAAAILSMHTHEGEEEQREEARIEE